MNGLLPSPAFLARDSRWHALRSAAYAALKAEFLDAVASGNAATRVRIPGAEGRERRTVAIGELLDDQLFGDEATAGALMQLLRDAMHGEDVALRAALLLSTAAEKHARFHEADVVVED